MVSSVFILCIRGSRKGFLGRQRAWGNVVRELPPVYSGMMCYEKAARELPCLGFMFEMPIVVAGVGVSGN